MIDWITFCVKMLIAAAAILFVAFLVNPIGDCAASVVDCGESGRRVSFLVLSFGLIGLSYYAYLFVSGRRRR